MREEKIAYVEMEFGPVWNYVLVVRNFIESFLSTSIHLRKGSDVIVMAIGELVGNAVKYSNGNHAALALQVYSSRIVVKTKNQTNRENALRLEREFQEINLGSPIEAYTKKLKYMMDNPDKTHSFGLVRIRHEANSILECNICGEHVEIVVTCPINP